MNTDKKYSSFDIEMNHRFQRCNLPIHYLWSISEIKKFINPYMFYFKYLSFLKHNVIYLMKYSVELMSSIKNNEMHIFQLTLKVIGILPFYRLFRLANAIFRWLHTEDYIHYIHVIFGHSYPEWPHRQGGCLECCGCTFDSRRGCPDLYCAREAQRVLPMRVGGATSQLDLPSLTPLSVAGCGWLQEGVPHWAASVHYYK